MELIIKIPDEAYHKWYVRGKMDKSVVNDAMENAIKLPKGHGRIIDESKITHTWWETKEELRLERLNCVNKHTKHRYVVLRGTDAPTIVEAERSKEK